ncbi:MAG: hypothetical protein C0177_01410, partial [Fervidicoccus fontis]
MRIRRSGEKVTVTVLTYSGGSAVVVARVLVESGGDVRWGIPDPNIENIVSQVVESFIPRWDEVCEVKEAKDAAELYFRTPYKGPRPHTSPSEELATAVAEMIKQRHIIKTFAHESSIVDIYCFSEGYYKPCRNELLMEIGSLATSMELLKKKFDKDFVDEVLYKVAGGTLSQVTWDYNFIVFENKLFDWRVFFETGNLVEALKDPDPEIMVMHRIPNPIDLDTWRAVRPGLQQYIPPKNCSDLVALLRQLAPATYNYLYSLAYVTGASQDFIESRICFLVQMVGRMMLPGYRVNGVIVEKLKNIFALLGKTNTGKSTFLQDYTGDVVLGKENYRITDLARLTSLDSEDRLREFHDLRGTLMVIHPDIGRKSRVQDWSIIRDVSGGDRIKARGLYKDSYEYYPSFKIAISSNDPPPIGEEGEALKALLQRFKVFETWNTFTGKTLDIKPLKAEVSRAVIAYLYGV